MFKNFGALVLAGTHYKEVNMKDYKDIWIIEGKNQKRRKAKTSICKFCKNSFLQRKNGKQIYCSKECLVTFNSNGKHTYVKCKNCNKSVRKLISRLKKDFDEGNSFYFEKTCYS